MEEPRRYGRLISLACLLYLTSPVVPAQQEMPPAPVRIATVELRAIAPVMWVAGTVISQDDARIATEVDGRITWIADVGQYVERDQPVAIIDDTRLKLQRSEAASNVKSLETRIAFLRKEVERSEQLARSKLTSETAIDQVRSDYDGARADLEAAQARLGLIDDSLARTRITAPFNGYVTERLHRTGETVTENTPVLHLVGLENLEIEATAPLRYVFFLQRGEVLDVRSFETRASATLRSLVSIGANESRQFVMRLDFEQDDWLPGLPVRVAIPTESKAERLVVPRDALVLRRDGASVFRVGADAGAEQVSVTPDIGAGDLIAVKGDLKPGDRVVIRGAERLRPGQKVNILDEQKPDT